MRSITAFLGVAALTACSQPAEMMEFRSDKEKTCYEAAQADLSEPGQSLKRARDGVFVIVTEEHGFVSDIDRSETFDACMASAGPSMSGIAETGSITLSAEEQVIWNSLTDDAKRDALAYIQGGGTLKDFVAG